MYVKKVSSLSHIYEDKIKNIECQGSILKKINERNINALQITPLAFNALIPVSFSLVEACLKLLFWYGMKLCDYISFNILHFLKSFCMMNFQFKK